MATFPLLLTGVTIGGEVSLTLKLPGDVLEAGAGYKREKTITKTYSSTEEETLTWEGDSIVKVSERDSHSKSWQVG